MIEAIGVYDKEFNKLHAAQYGKSKGTFFKEPNLLQDMEDITLKKLPALQAGKIYNVKVKDQQHYVRSMGEKIITICTRKPLEPIEVSHLMLNINHIITNAKFSGKLNDVIMNPLGYTGRDILLQAATTQIEEIQKIMLANIEKTLERGEKIEELINKSIKLNDDAIKFKHDAAKLNACCRWG